MRFVARMYLFPCAIFALTLTSSGLAWPVTTGTDTVVHASDSFTTTLAAKKWDYGPLACTDQPLFCLVMEKAHFGGWKHLYCHPDHTLDTGNFQTFFFSGHCEGQLIMNCPDEHGTTHRGLTEFSLGAHGNFSTFFTADPGVKGITSDLQTFDDSSGKVTVRGDWADAQILCKV